MAIYRMKFKEDCSEKAKSEFLKSFFDLWDKCLEGTHDDSDIYFKAVMAQAYLQRIVQGTQVGRRGKFFELALIHSVQTKKFPARV